MGDANWAAEQPDFDVICVAFHAIAEEMAKIQNLPAIANGTQILAEILQVRDEMITRLSISEHNNVARIQNVHVKVSSGLLSPLVNSSTGEAIPGFPATSQEIEGMAEPQLDAVLRELGLSTPVLGTTRIEKERQLRVQLGLIERPA